ncbi:hypothetical protein [Sphingomonas phyllosphaerae]|uniref:hypothetical protein n=1 Tax=Sphingomonas phyllosphaerae TaxID=257003 RepID=UPI0003FE8D50|nr:hypothetical protein [Sphingomonas phyllosphaerae]
MTNTATMHFTSPTDMAMTSASGKFLPAVSDSALPERRTWLKMILDFGVISYILRRRTMVRFV